MCVYMCAFVGMYLDVSGSVCVCINRETYNVYISDIFFNACNPNKNKPHEE